MIEVVQTTTFQTWLASLHDQRAVDRIATRIARLRSGLLGDAKFFGGIGELRIDYGPGYRLYILRRGTTVIVLLCGGDKGSQARDIRHAKELAKEFR